MTTKLEIKLSLKDRARVKELYHIMPNLSARAIAKQLGLNKRDTLNYMRLLGYSTESHMEALRTKAMPKRTIPVPKPKPTQAPNQPKTTIPPCAISHKPSPETCEKQKQKELQRKAHKLLEMATKAGEEGRFEDYLKLRKEYEIADRQAKAYKQRGTLSASDKVIYGLESRYQTNI